MDARAFYARRGYKVWYGLDELIYWSGRLPDPLATLPRGVEIRPYDDTYYFDFIRVEGDAFEAMRRGHDFRPHNVLILNTSPDQRQQFWSQRDDIFFLFEDGRLVGEAAVEGDFLDEVAVAPTYQGKGYGRALTAYCVNLLLGRGHRGPLSSRTTTAPGTSTTGWASNSSRRTSGPAGRCSPGRPTGRPTSGGSLGAGRPSAAPG